MPKKKGKTAKGKAIKVVAPTAAKGKKAATTATAPSGGVTTKQRAAKKRKTTETYLMRLREAVDSVEWGRQSTPRLPLEDRGVTPAFLRKILEATGGDRLAPGQLVHGRHTRGPPDDWREFDAARDPLSIRALTISSGLSLVETATIAAREVGDASLVTDEASGKHFFGAATDFISYTWHGISFQELCECLLAQDGSTDSPASLWVDVFAVTQHSSTPRTHSNSQADLNFERVIDATSRLRAVMTPWSDPKMLRRCWCLREIQVAIAGGKAIDVVLRPQEEALFRPTARANFHSIFSTMVYLIDSEQAQATRAEDARRILGEIRDSIGFDELNMRVLVLLHSWLRGVAGEPALDDATTCATVREAMARLASYRAEQGGAAVERAEGGVLTIGSIVVGGTDAAQYLTPLDESDTSRGTTGGSSGGTVDPHAHFPSGSKIHGEYDAMLIQTNVSNNNNKFYKASSPCPASLRRALSSSLSPCLSPSLSPLNHSRLAPYPSPLHPRSNS